MKKDKLTNHRPPQSIQRWIYRRCSNFSRSILYSYNEDGIYILQNSSITLSDNELPLYECFGKDNESSSTYLLITTLQIISIIGLNRMESDIEDLNFDMKIEEIIESRNNRTRYQENIKYEIKTTNGFIPLWVEVGINEHILWGVLTQISFLLNKHLKNDR